ncbi:tetraspanin 37 isoform X2 [Myripristis murdjan]|uniref:tetraspanin 37 isoform X2 n=1 Tax=Myripristis murdjan TaxID=586833 RepID=UPI0011761175|nr:tetraspanin-3-like isoform X2 [Myripristis murdjan]
MTDRRRRTLKIVLQITCQLLWLVGLMVGLCGVYLLLNCTQNSLFLSHSYLILPAIFALVTAAFLLISGCLGCWVSTRESAFLQGLLHSEVAPLRGVFQRYTASSQDPESRAVDAAQEELQCCGVRDYRDWLETPWFNRSGGLGVPHSCCNSTFYFCNGTLAQPWKLYGQGCQVKLEDTIQFVLNLIMWSFLPVVLVEIFGFVTVAHLMKDQPLLQYHILGRS